MSRSDHQIVDELREKSRHLASMLDDFSDRLRRMRRRNREVEQEIADFERELERMKEWLDELNDS